jgi:hypothetical protein
MSVLAKFNKYMYEYKYSLFDIAYIAMIGTLAVDNWLWFLALIPCAFISVKLNRIFA